MDASARVGVGIIGVGNIADLDVPGYLEHPGCDVVALCDPRREHAEERAARWGVPRVYTELDDLLADPALDAVEILTPTHLHVDHVLAAAAAGKHISCQKPIATNVPDARRMIDAASEAGVLFRLNENCCHYEPLVRARQLVAAGEIGDPEVIRIKTVVGRTDSEFQGDLDHEGYFWRLDERSPGGHLFDDVFHKYAMAWWLLDREITSVQAIVRQGPFFFEAPTVAMWEYDTPDLLGMMEVSLAPDMLIRSEEYGADEFFEIQGTSGFLWVTRLCGQLHDLPPLVLYRGDGTTVTFADIDARYERSHRRSAAAFVDALLEGRTGVDLDPELGTRILQMAFAVYQASNERRPVDPASIEGSVSPEGWPPSAEKLVADFERWGDRFT